MNKKLKMIALATLLGVNIVNNSIAAPMSEVQTDLHYIVVDNIKYIKSLNLAKLKELESAIKKIIDNASPEDKAACNQHLQNAQGSLLEALKVIINKILHEDTRKIIFDNLPTIIANKLK